MPIQILHSFSLFLNGDALLATIDKDMLYDYLVAIFVHKKIVGYRLEEEDGRKTLRG